MKTSSAAIVLVTAVVCVLPFALLREAPEPPGIWRIGGATMGTTFTVSAVADSSASDGEEILPAVTERLAWVNRLMSTYDPGSELSEFNAAASTDWFAVSRETAEVVAFALKVAEDSDGAYDPTVGPVVNLWGFGPGKNHQTPPTNEQIADARADVGWRLIESRLDPPALRKQAPGVYLDLSSVAKGFGVDEVSRVAAEADIANHMVDIGGEVVCRGLKPDGSPWRIGIQKPDSLGRLLQAAVELKDEAIATSGDYFNAFEHEGVRYSHTIDPKTGRPVTHDTASVTVRASDCMTADALATALLVLGADAGYDWATERDVAAMFVSRADEGYEERTTPAWDTKAEAAR